jgi:hypothetical protein
VIPLAIALGAIASQLLFGVLHKPDDVLGQPIAVVTSWGWSGVAAWSIYAATMLVAGAGYWLAIVRSRQLSLATILSASALACMAALAFRFILSSDVYAYAAYGALSATHQDPYVHRTFPPAQLIDPAWTRAIGFEWPSLPACIYGPAFIALARAIVLTTHFDLAATLAVFRIASIVAFVAAVAIAARVVPERGRLLAAVVGLNPVVISTVAEGHNDALVFLLAAISAYVALRKPEIAGFLAGASALLKATGAVVALGLAYALGNRRFAVWACVAIAASIAIQLLATQLSGGYQSAAPTDFVGSSNAAITMGIHGLIALGLVVRALYNAGSGARAAALAAAALAIWALYPQDYPWYGMWLLPLAAFTLERREGAVLLVLTFSSTLRYLSDAYGFAPAAPWLELIALVIPLAAFSRDPLPT